MTSNYFYIFIILLGFTCLYLVTIYIQTLYAFKKDYAQYKCNPIMMPFSAAFGENPVDVFNECIQAQQSATTEKYSSNLFTNLSTNNDNVTNINSMNTATITDQADFKNTIMGPDLGDMGGSSNGMLPKMGNTQKAISIQTTKIAAASMHVMETIMANIKAIILALEAVPVVAEGVLNSPPLQMVKDIGVLTGN